MSRRTFSILLLALIGFRPSQAAAQRELLAGPFVFERSAGTPDTFTQSFEVCDPEGSFWLVAENGSAQGAGRLSSVWVRVNGSDVILPRDLNQQVGRVERPVQLAASNRLEVVLASGPSGVLTVRIEGITNCLKLEEIEPPSGSVIDDEYVYIRGKVRSQAREVVLTWHRWYGEPLPGQKELEDGTAFQKEPQAGMIFQTEPEVVAFGQFAISVPLYEDKPTNIYLRTRDDRGNTVRTILTYTGTQQLHHFRVTAKPATTHPGHHVSFLVDANSKRLPNGESSAFPERLKMDFDGDGSFDFEGSRGGGVPAIVDHTYERPGFYHVRSEVFDAAGQRLMTRFTPVAIFESPSLDEKFMEMVAHLERGDLEAALHYIARGRREVYREALSRMAERLPGGWADVAARYNSRPTLLSFGNSLADYEYIREVDGKRYLIGARWIRDFDGFWRLADF